ncbi:MAG: tail fiber protein [Opitutaceae bacterium]|jgi:microcystin-dependent protein
MSEPYLGEVRCVGFDYAPDGWAQCNGQTVPVNQYQALFALIGTTYGGDGVNTFGLPNLCGRGVVGQNISNQGTRFVDGQSGGSETVTLTPSTLPAHAHAASITFTTNPSLKAAIAVVDTTATLPSPATNALAQSKIGGGRPKDVNTYAATPTAGATLSGVNATGTSYPGGVVALAGSGVVAPAPIAKLPPVVVGNYIIALNGLFPQRP